MNEHAPEFTSHTLNLKVRADGETGLVIGSVTAIDLDSSKSRISFEMILLSDMSIDNYRVLFNGAQKYLAHYQYFRTILNFENCSAHVELNVSHRCANICSV